MTNENEKAGNGDQSTADERPGGSSNPQSAIRNPQSDDPQSAIERSAIRNPQSIARSAGIVSVAVMGSRILGLVREWVFSTFFGASFANTAFIIAFRIPNLLRDLFAEGALSAAFVATFTWRLEHDGEAAAWRLANLVVNALAIVVGAITLAGIWFAPALVTAIAPGFADIPGKVELTVALTRIMFPFLLLVALAAVAMGILNTRHIFGGPAAASPFFHPGSIAGGPGCAAWLPPRDLSRPLRRRPGPRPGPLAPALTRHGIRTA